MFANQDASFLNMENHSGVGDTLPYAYSTHSPGKSIIQKPLKIFNVESLKGPSHIRSLQNVSEKLSTDRDLSFLGGRPISNIQTFPKHVQFSDINQYEIINNINEYLKSPDRKMPNPFDRDPAEYQRPRNVTISKHYPVPPIAIPPIQVPQSAPIERSRPPNFNTPLPPPLIQYPMNPPHPNLSPNNIGNGNYTNDFNSPQMPLQPNPTQINAVPTQFPQFSSRIEYSGRAYSQSIPGTPEQLINSQNVSYARNQNSPSTPSSANVLAPSMYEESQIHMLPRISSPVAGPMQRPLESTVNRAVSPTRYQQRFMGPEQLALVHGFTEGTVAYQPPPAPIQAQLPPTSAVAQPPPPPMQTTTPPSHPFSTPSPGMDFEYKRLPAPYSNVWVPPVILPRPPELEPEPEPYLPEPLHFHPLPEHSRGDFQEPPHIAYCRQLAKFRKF